MGRLLEALRVEVAPAANPANPANVEPGPAQDSQIRKIRKDSEDENALQTLGRFADSQESQGPRINTAAVRARLLVHAEALHADPALIRSLSEPDLVAYGAVPDALLAEYVGSMVTTAERQAGRVPAGDTAAIHCQGCGPVWVHPSIATMLPTVAGWPRALGCPWCAVRRAGQYIPRPKVTCENCRHFTADTINPGAGMGDCGQGHGSPYPMQRRACAHFDPIKEATL